MRVLQIFALLISLNAWALSEDTESGLSPIEICAQRLYPGDPFKQAAFLSGAGTFSGYSALMKKCPNTSSLTDDDFRRQIAKLLRKVPQQHTAVAVEPQVIQED